MQLGSEDILVIEGIHGLNDKLTYSIPKKDKYKIYISALTTLNIDHHNRIPTTEGRLYAELSETQEPVAIQPRKPFLCGIPSAAARAGIFSLIRKRQMRCLTRH